MIECQNGVPISESAASLPGHSGEKLASFSPSPRLRHALLALREALHQELGEGAIGKRHWLLLEGPGGTPSESLEVSKVLDELRQRFQGVLGPAGSTPQQGAPDLESFLREKMRQMGFDDVSTGPLLPELQREALRGLGVGLGSQMAQLLGKLAGWHGDARSHQPPKQPAETKGGQQPARILKLEVGPRIATGKASALELRSELARARRNLSLSLGWDIVGLHLALCKDLPDARWRLTLRNEEIAQGANLTELLSRFEPTLREHAAELLTFAEFDAMARAPGCRPVVKELRAQGLEKATLWTLFRRRLSQGLDLRDPLTLFERILEASVVSVEPEHLIEALS